MPAELTVEAGRYTFICEFHPTMTGTVSAVESCFLRRRERPERD